ncbi:uncharacterized protein LOC143208196 isoform X6 [Lasioglossum baleicum]|uniref:uncharacterized protein LOC143208196 isoform X6 n=1 Tax=Lasioglossum baleicum TaxID=434251 RepID=UPI003FCD9768
MPTGISLPYLTMWKLPLLWREQGRRLSVRWITGAELGRRTSSSLWWGGSRPSERVRAIDSLKNTQPPERRKSSD